MMGWCLHTPAPHTHLRALGEGVGWRLGEGPVSQQPLCGTSRKPRTRHPAQSLSPGCQVPLHACPRVLIGQRLFSVAWPWVADRGGAGGKAVDKRAFLGPPLCCGHHGQ